jgi:hypothetical protein
MKIKFTAQRAGTRLVWIKKFKTTTLAKLTAHNTKNKNSAENFSAVFY